MMTSYINGTYFKEPTMSPFDLGFLRGFGVIETFRTLEKRPLFLKKHLGRLEKSAKEVGIRLSHSLKEIEEIIHFLIEKNGFDESVIRVILTKGISEDGITPVDKSSLMILTSAFIPLPSTFYEQGISALTTSEKRVMPHIKTLYYLPALYLLEKARAKGAREVFYTEENHILEGTTCNFFAIKNDTLITASEHILLGITRANILKQVQESFSIEFRPLHLDELESIDEAFTSSSVKWILPVIAINGKKIGKGVPGPKTAKIDSLLRRALFEFTLD